MSVQATPHIEAKVSLGRPSARACSRRRILAPLLVLLAHLFGCAESREAPASPERDGGSLSPPHDRPPGSFPGARIVRAASRRDLVSALKDLEAKAPALAHTIREKLETFDLYRRKWRLTAPLVVGQVRLAADVGTIPAPSPEDAREGETVSRPAWRPMRVEEVDAPMEILEDGYFVAALGNFERPIQLRLPGYEPVDVDIEGLRGGPERVFIGELSMFPAPERTLGTLRGRIQIPPGYSMHDLDMHLTMGPEVVNSPNGWRERRPEENLTPLIDVVFDEDGRFEIEGLSPSEYKLWLLGLDVVSSTRALAIQPGERKDLGTVEPETKRTANLTYVVAEGRGDKFSKGPPLQASLRDGDTWSPRADKGSPVALFELQQKNRTLFARSSEGTCTLVDLGAGTLERSMTRPQRASGERVPCDLALAPGHVYRLEHGKAGITALFRVEVTDDPPLCDTLLPASGPNARRWSPPEGRPLPREVQAYNATFREPQGPTWKWVNVWASWCGPCMQEMPLLDEWRRALLEQDHPIVFEMWSLDEDLPELLYAQKHGLPGPVRWAPEGGETLLAKALGLRGGEGIPIHALVDPSGQVRCVRRGEVDERGFPALRRLLRSL